MNKATTIGIVLLVLSAVFIIFAYYAFVFPGQLDYDRRFTTLKVMLVDSSNFEKMDEHLLRFWSEMNNTFAYIPRQEWKSTYGSYFFWDYKYENSLDAQDNYLAGLHQRLLANIEEAYQVKIGNRTIMVPYQIYYDQMLNATRSEIKREGDLDWALGDIFIFHKYPMAYFWTSVYGLMLFIALFLVSIVVLSYGLIHATY